MFPNHLRVSAIPLVCLGAGLLLVGCDQSINRTGGAETKLTGTYCDAKGIHEQDCKAGDVIATVQGRERLLCDWGWQIVHEPGSDEVLCVDRGPLRAERPPGPESVK